VWGYDLNHFDADSSFVSRPLPQALQPLPLLIDDRAASFWLPAMMAALTLTPAAAMALDQLKAFLARMQADEALKGQVLAAATADDVAQIALKLGFEFSGDELLRVSGQRFDRVTVRKNDIPGEYN